jgi:hypothetical protein
MGFKKPFSENGIKYCVISSSMGDGDIEEILNKQEMVKIEVLHNIYSSVYGICLQENEVIPIWVGARATNIT